MSSKIVKQPGPDHPITIAQSADRMIVRVAGRTVADSSRTLMLSEASYPGVHYFPREDVDLSLLAPNKHTTYCPYKGDCTYYSIPLGGERSIDAVWTYESPYDAVAQIAGYLAFYPTRVDVIERAG